MIAIASSPVGGVVCVVDMVVLSSLIRGRLVNGDGDVCDRRVGGVCDRVIRFEELQHKLVLSVGGYDPAEPALSKDR